MFSILKKKFGKADYYQLHNDQTGEFIGIIPEVGGLINDFCVESDKKLLNIFDNYKTYDELMDEVGENFKGVKLSPYPNRIRNGKYTFENETHEFVINVPEENNSLHGVVYNKAFEVLSTQTSEGSASIILAYDYDGTDKGFPFKYRMEQQITFSKGNELSVETKIENKDIRAIPMADGWHPYISTGAKVNDLVLEFQSKGQVVVDEALIPTDEVLAFKDFNKALPVADKYFNDCYTLDENTSKHITTIVDEGKGVAIDIWQQGGNKAYNYVQIYTPPSRDSIAIEPMTCIPDAFNNEIGLLILAPNEELVLHYGINVAVN